MPFERLVEEVSGRRDLATHPLFEVIFTYDENPPSERRLAGLAVSDLAGEALPIRTRFDLEVYFRRDAKGLQAVLVGRRDLFDPTTLLRLRKASRRSLKALCPSPAGASPSSALLPDAERHQVLREWNDAPAVVDGGRRLHEIFADVARHRDEAAAVLGEDGTTLTYGELERRANALAFRLRGLGVGPEARVGSSSSAHPLFS